MKRVMALALRDVRDITRDAVLCIALVVPFLVSAVVRWGLPLLNELLLRELNFDLAVHDHFIRSLLMFLTPMMLGMLVGMMILDERDENILTYFAVTPFRKFGYLVYRIFSVVVLGIGFSYMILLLTETQGVNYLRLAPVILMAALEAPLYALVLGAFAANKVEGLALAKALGVLMGAPMVGYLVHSPWQLLAGVLPPYWVSRAFLASVEGGLDYWIAVVAGLLIHGVYIWWFIGRFLKRVE